MNALAIFLLAALSVPQVSVGNTPRIAPHFAELAKATHSKKSGKWYFGQTGHAVYCYGPVMTVASASGNLQRVATFCKGDNVIVPLKD